MITGLNSVIVIVVIALVLLLAAYAFLCRQRLSQLSRACEDALLALADRASSRNEYPQLLELQRQFASPRKRTRLTPRLSLLVRTIDERVGQLEQLVVSYGSLVEGGLDAAGSAHDLASAAARLARIVVESGSSTIIAAAFVARDGSNTDLRMKVLGYSGAVPLARLKEPLIGIAESAIDNRKSGYLDQDDQFANLKIFGVAQSFIASLPMINNDPRTAGVLWIGLKGRSELFDPAQQKLIHRAVIFGGACFEVARRVDARGKGERDERDFLVGLSHDLKAPSNAALMAVRNVLDFSSALSADTRSSLELVEHCLVDGVQLISDVLDLARYRQQLLKARSELLTPQVISALVESYRSSAEQKGLRFIAEPCLSSATFDRNHLRRVLSNLISNAIKYTTVGEVRVSFFETEGWIEIHVVDTGCGISAEEEQRLFEPFKRFKSEGRVDGHGLGLTVSRLLAEINAGYLRFCREKTGGSRFILGAPSSGRAGSGRSGQVTAASKSRKIIIVDDDPGTLRSYRRYLSEHESVSTAASCDEACKLFEAERDAVLVTDYYLPDGTARDLLERLSSKGLRPPTIVTSGDVQAGDSIKDEWRPPNFVTLRKPVRREELVEAVESLDAAA
jgi:two-component system, sensor histidine kinase